MRRIFAAVDISVEARIEAASYIETLQNEFRAVRTGWERSEKLHLTLKFLGDTSENQLETLNKIARKVAGKTPKFNLQIAETGIFPSAGNPRVLWIDVKDEAGSLAKINNLLETECEKIGFERERRKFVPHLTIGRVREPNRASGLAKKHLENKFEPVEFEVSEIVIYESKLLPTGSVYSVVSKHELE